MHQQSSSQATSLSPSSSSNSDEEGYSESYVPTSSQSTQRTSQPGAFRVQGPSVVEVQAARSSDNRYDTQLTTANVEPHINDSVENDQDDVVAGHHHNQLMTASVQPSNTNNDAVETDQEEMAGCGADVVAEPVPEDEQISYAIRLRDGSYSGTRRGSFQAVVLDAEPILEVDPDRVHTERHPNAFQQEVADEIRNYYWQRVAFRTCVVVILILGLGLGLTLGLRGNEQEPTATVYADITTNTTTILGEMYKPHVPRKISRALSWTLDGFADGLLFPFAFSGNCSIAATSRIFANEIEWVQTIQYDTESMGWMLLGEELVNDIGKLGNRFGGALAVSSDGLVLAVSMPRDDPEGIPDAGSVRVYSRTPMNDTWSPLGSDFHGNEANEWMGTIVMLSSDGHTIAMSSPLGAKTAGVARVFRYDSTSNEWTQAGTDIVGGGSTSYLSYVDLSADGNIVVVGAQYDDTADTNAGSVRVFRFDTSEDDWVQIGQSIYGEDAGAQFGTYVHISKDGHTVAFSNGEIDESRLARVYSYHDGEDLWIQDGNDQYGQCLKLSDDGKRVIMCSAKVETCSIYSFDNKENDWKLIVTLEPDPTTRFLPLDFRDDGKEVCGLLQATFIDNNATDDTTTT
eukprot:CAMPEP_0181078186 /NCGR_PEP_ID=MMETSP1071-20121207/1351_1 /TAXON_ID=35127 /ORGANISM="Thalassiosira sp., Strain NH16" /LENGTH=627 /DNA_ID=CAMNT_0023159483 /DNA_START=218 /DNA_END=2097 /DNA_ORIENTATION=+